MDDNHNASTSHANTQPSGTAVSLEHTNGPLSNQPLPSAGAVPGNGALESHQVIELQAFADRKTWIGERIQFLSKMPPIEVFVGLEAIKTSQEVVPGLPTREELQQWLVEHDAIEKETEIIDTGELNKLREFTRAATQRNLSPEDTDLIELTLTTIYELDKLLHLLRDRSDNLDLLGVRLTWEAHRATAWQERRKIISDLQSFLEARARWNRTVYDGMHEERNDRHDDSSPPQSRVRRTSVVSIASVASDATSSGQFSRSARFRFAELLSRDAAQFSGRVSALRHNHVLAAGKILDKLIDNSRRPVPDALLDEQDKLEEKGIHELEDVGKFLMHIVMQWRKADEIYVETLKDQSAAQMLLEEMEVAHMHQPTARQSATFITRSEALSKRIFLRGNPTSPGSAFPMPSHPLFQDQEPFNVSLALEISAEVTTTAELITRASSMAKEYRNNLEAVQRVQSLVEQAELLSRKTLSVVDRLENGVKSSDGDGSPLNLTTEHCLDPTRHSVFLALLPSIVQEGDEAAQAVHQLKRNMTPALLRIDFSGLDSAFKANAVSTVTSLVDLVESAQQVQKDVAARASRLKAARKVWTSMRHSAKQLESLQRDLAEAMDKHRWKEEVKHPHAPLTPDSPPHSALPSITPHPDILQQIEALRTRLADDVEDPLNAIPDLESFLKGWLEQRAHGLRTLLQQVDQMSQMLGEVKQQATVLSSIRDEFSDFQVRIEGIKLDFENCQRRLLDGITAVDDNTSDLHDRSNAIRLNVRTFVDSLHERLPFVSRPQSPRFPVVKRSFSPVDLKIGISDRPTIDLPFDPHSPDESARYTTNTIAMRLNGELHSLEQKTQHFALAKLARSLDLATSLLRADIAEASEQLESSRGTFIAISQEPDQSTLDDLAAVLELVGQHFEEHYPRLQQALSQTQGTIQQMSLSPGANDVAVHDALVLSRRHVVDATFSSFMKWKSGVQDLRARISDAQRAAAQRLDAARAAEKLRVEEERERLALIEQLRLEEEARRIREEEERHVEAERIRLAEEAREREEADRKAKAAEEQRLQAEQRQKEEDAANHLREAQERAEALALEQRRLEQERLEAEIKKTMEEEALKAEAHRLREAERQAVEDAERVRLHRENSEMEVKLRLAEAQLAEQRDIQAQKDRLAEAAAAEASRQLEEERNLHKKTLQNPTANLHLDADVFDEPEDLGAQITRLRKRLVSIHITEALAHTSDLPSAEAARHMQNSLHPILDAVETLPDRHPDALINSELVSLRAECADAAIFMKRLAALVTLLDSVATCDNALSDLLEHVDSYPALPIGPLACSFVSTPGLTAEHQLRERLQFTQSTLQIVDEAVKETKGDPRAAAEQLRLSQTWAELEEMARDRMAGRRSRPSSVASSGGVSGRNSSVSLLPPHRINRKTSTYSNLSASTSRESLNPLRPRRVVSSEQRKERPASVSYSNSRSVSGPMNSTPRNSTFASRQRTNSLTPAVTPSTPTRRPSGSNLLRPRVSKRSASPSVSEISSHSHSTGARSSASTSTWSRAPRLSFPGVAPSPEKKVAPRKPYVANPRNKLDVAVGDVVNNLPAGINIEGVSGSWKDQSGKYWIGDQEPKLCFCRILRSQTVMVRVGGGWMELSKFIRNHFADSFRILAGDTPCGNPNTIGSREEKWINSSVLLEAPEIDSPIQPPRTPEPRGHIPSFSISSPTGSPRSFKSTPSTKGSPLSALQFMRRAEPETPILRPETPSKPSLRPRNTPLTTRTVWRP